MISGTGALNRAAKLASDNWCWRLLVNVLTVQNDVRSMTTSDARYMTRNHASGGDSVRVARSQALRQSAAEAHPTAVWPSRPAPATTPSLSAEVVFSQALARDLRP